MPTEDLCENFSSPENLTKNLIGREKGWRGEISESNGEGVIEILGFALASETNSYDRYVKMMYPIKDRWSAQIFHQGSGEEKQYLER